MTEKFDQASYWIKRHLDLQGDPRSVGNLGTSREASIAGERVFISGVSHVAEKLRGTGATSVLDLGCGYGRIAGCFTEKGFDYTGIDISPVAIDEARRRHPNAQFLVGNLSEIHLNRKFDVVIVLYVFVHFVDDAVWRAFLASAINRLKPEGVLVVADAFPHERTAYGRHVVCRPLSAYDEAFVEHGVKFTKSLRDMIVGSANNPNLKDFHFAIKD